MFQTIPAIMDILDSLGLSGWADRDKKKKKKGGITYTAREETRIHLNVLMSRGLFLHTSMNWNMKIVTQHFSPYVYLRDCAYKPILNIYIHSWLFQSKM